jgi:valyl-tRNA synthetase
MIKPAYQQPNMHFAKAIEMLENNLKLLHPFMPFNGGNWQISRKNQREALNRFDLARDETI